MPLITVTSIDHIVLTCASIEATKVFYTTHLGMSHSVFTSKDTERHALTFGTQKLNLHPASGPFEPHAQNVQPGSEDLCFITEVPIEEVLKQWKDAGLEILEGGEVVNRTGARGKLRSVYTRDPDGNLVE